MPNHGVSHRHGLPQLRAALPNSKANKSRHASGNGRPHTLHRRNVWTPWHHDDDPFTGQRQPSRWGNIFLAGPVRCHDRIRFAGVRPREARLVMATHRVMAYVAVGIALLGAGLLVALRPPTASVQGNWRSGSVLLQLHGNGTGSVEGGGWILTSGPREVRYDPTHKTMQIGVLMGSYEEIEGNRKFIFRFGFENKGIMIFERL